MKFNVIFQFLFAECLETYLFFIKSGEFNNSSAMCWYRSFTSLFNRNFLYFKRFCIFPNSCRSIRVSKEKVLNCRQEIDRSWIMNLPSKEKTVVALYYYEEMTLKEIGRTLGVSESRVSQIHTKAMLRLRGRLRVVRDSLLSAITERGSGEPDTPATVADQTLARELVTTH